VKTRELVNLGIPRGPVLKLAQKLLAAAAKDGHGKKKIRAMIADVVNQPHRHRRHPVFGELAEALMQEEPEPTRTFTERPDPAPWRQWGEDLEEQSVQQMVNACRLPIAVRGALMPDAHLGYGLPIGGVLAADNAVIPYAVGVDIACRMKLTVLDLPANAIESQAKRLENAIERETRFGIGAEFRDPHQHDVLDEDWTISPITRAHRDKAWKQLGTSGSGNHFVEFGVITIKQKEPEIGLEPGEYLALLSHSGSRGTGALVAGHYSRLAMDLHPELPKPLRHLAWLDLATEAGQEYWAVMSLMGRYAAANHAIIHRMIARNLKAKVLADLENHHNFAWKEKHEDPATGKRKTVIVHRKGATPAAAGDVGIIPGSMASPAYVVRGKGSAESLNSASHGAGRVMSRTQAKHTFRWADVRSLLEERGVTLLAAGLDEVPMVYKDIDAVMAAQQDLVEPLARFDPRIVKMARGGRAED
jgi:tRNA-splicing ligase RtcB